VDIPPDARVIVPGSVLMREVSGESVILDLNSEQYYGLDAVGTRMWAVLTASPSVGAALETLLDEYDVEREVLLRDVTDLLGRLAALGLVEIGGA
jgi:hypothetical protein